MPIRRHVPSVPYFILLILCAVLSWPLTHCAIARADDAVLSNHVTIPFTSLPGHGHIVVRILFNDKLTGNFLLDTGSYASLMDDTFARKLGLKLQLTVRRAPVAESAIQIYEMTIDRMRLGDLTLRDVHMLVVPHRSVPKGGSESVCAKEEAKDQLLHPEMYQNRVLPPDQRLDGILGMDYLREFAFFIDFPHQQVLGWAYGNVSADDLAGLGMEHATVVPLMTDDRHLNAYFVNAGFATAAGRVVEKEEVDTGAEGTMMTPHLADKIKVPVKGHYFAQTLYGCLPFSAGPVDTVDLDGMSVPGTIVSFTRKAPEGFPVLLGYDVFSRCRVLFDFPAKQMYIEPIPDIALFLKPSAEYSDPITYAPGPNGEIFLTVQFDGSKTGTFALDTGADRTIISPGLATSLNLALAPLLDASGNVVLYQGSPLRTGRLPVMRFGGTGIGGFACAAASAPIMAAGKNVDGILGTDFCSAFLPFIDFPNHQVTFLQGRGLDGGDLEKLGMGSAAEITVSKPSPGVFCVPVEVKQGTTMDEDFTVSTLDQATILSSRVTQTMAFKPSGSARQIVTPMGTVNAAPVALDEFTLAGISAPDGMSVYLQTDGPPLPQSALGLDLLSHYRVLFDYPSGRLFLANPATAVPPSAPPPAATVAPHP